LFSLFQFKQKAAEAVAKEPDNSCLLVVTIILHYGMAFGDKPLKLREDLVVSEQDIDGEKYFVLKDPITRRYFRVREVEYFLIRQFNGQNDFNAITKNVRENFSLNISIEAVEKFAAKVNSLYFFEGSKAEYEISSGRYKGRHKKSLFSRILFVKLKAFNPDRLLNVMLPPSRFLFQPWAVTLMMIFVLAGFLTYSANFDGFRFSPGELFNVGSIIVIIASLAFIIFIHEFAHALTCKYFGGQVYEMGFLLLYFQLCFYSNLSDSWLFRRKSSRLAVIWAGLFFQMVIFAAAVFGWRVTVVGTTINQVFWLIANVCFIMLLFNVNPLIKLDGYYLLSEMLNIPNLRSRSFGFIKHRIKRLIGVPSQQPGVTRRERRIFISYTILAGIYSILLIVYIAAIVYRFLVDNLGGAGFILFLLVLTVIFKNPIARTIKFFISREVMKALISRPRNLIVGGIVVIALILLLFIIPFPRQAGGAVVVRPISEYTITLLSQQGLLELNLREGGHKRRFNTEHIQLFTGDLAVLRLTPLVREGDVIRKGDTLTAIASNQVSSSLSAARSELERLKGELALAQSPPKPEETDKAQSEVNAAAINVEQLQREIERNLSLFEKKLISEQELEQSQWSLNLARSKLKEAKARLRLLKSPPKREEISILQSRITAQKANINYLVTQEAAQAITSPIDGILVALNRNNLLFKVADMSRVETAIPVTDNYLELIETEADIKLKVRTYPNDLFRGRVTHISYSADEKYYGDSRARFEVYATIDNKERQLKDGMSGYAKISCGRASLFTILTERIKSYIRVEFWSWW